MLPHQDGCDLRSEPADDHALGVYDIPMLRQFPGFREITLHGALCLNVKVNNIPGSPLETKNSMIP